MQSEVQMIEYRHKSNKPHFQWLFQWLPANTYNLYTGRMTVKRSQFLHYDFRVDDVVFAKWSKEFEHALDKECTWRKLRD